MNANISSNDKYLTAQIKRQKHIEAITKSTSRKKIIVAGPGTGKTYLFKEILKEKNNTLTLTFINTLVEDLSLELYGLSDVKTLHGFARSSLGSIVSNVKIFPKLSKVIKEDAKILLNKEIDFDKLFHNLDDKNEFVDFYKKRKDYYGYYGYSDVIFALIKFYEKRKDKIPTFEQILVDEFQDFNKLEVSLIDLLSEKSPILIVGDDDQALYDFKSASTEFIRQRFINTNIGYTPFTLPFCSRCTKVIVNAVNDIVSMALKSGFLKGRVNKDYQYFEEINKDTDSLLNPKIIYNHSFERQIPWFIEKSIGEMANQIKNKFSVLIISPTKLKSSIIVNALRKRGFENIEYTEKREEREVTMLDGIKILLNDGKSNLGWRIVSSFIMQNKDFESFVKETNKNGTKDICNIIDKKYKKEVTEILALLRVVRDDKMVDENKFSELLKKVNLNPYNIAKEFFKNEIISDFQQIGNPGLRKIPIKATTIQSSKGLAADCVFVTHFDDLYFIKDKDKSKISDKDICNFLVVLTRARKKIFLISSNNTKEPIFLRWINNGNIERL